jgi:lambda repressor-like predicted transcriptional regulator
MAADIGASRQSVYAILEDNGRSLKARRRATVVGMYLAYCQGVSLSEVAERNGLSVKTIQDTFRTYRLPLRKRTRKVRVPSGRQAGEMRALIERNRERSVQAARVHVERSIAALEYAKQNPPRTRVKTEAWLRQIEALNARIENPGASLKEIAMKLGMTKDAYSRLLARGWSNAEMSSRRRSA